MFLMRQLSAGADRFFLLRVRANILGSEKNAMLHSSYDLLEM